jgi:DNA-binding SARP family transcriptional activator
MIEFHALGASDLGRCTGHRFLTLLSKPKQLALLVYLTQATPHGFHRRDKLIALLWPDLDHQHARTALRKALHFLRGVLGPASLQVRGDEVAVSRQHIWCDAVAFEEAVQAGDEARALELYRGPLLEGLHVSTAPEFERWLETARRRLRRAAAEAALGLAKEREANGDAPNAVVFVRRAITIEPYHEVAYQALIQLLDRLGDRAAAVTAYEELKTRLARDLEVAPAPETLALIQAVRARDEVPPPQCYGSI